MSKQTAVNDEANLLDQALRKLTNSVKRLEDDRSPSKEEVDLAMQIILEVLPIVSTCKEAAYQYVVQDCGIRLYNTAVVLSEGKQLTGLMNARLRKISCDLVWLSNKENETESAMEQNAQLAMKAGRAFMDCKSASEGSVVLSMAFQCWETLIHRFAVQDRPLSISRGRLGMDILLLKAQADWDSNHRELALPLIGHAISLVSKLPAEENLQVTSAINLQTIAHNFGLDMLNKKLVGEAILWFSKSIEIGNEYEEAINQYAQSKNISMLPVYTKTWQLLAMAHLDSDLTGSVEQALNAIGHAIALMPDPNSYNLRVKALIKAGNTSVEDLDHALESVFECDGLTVDQGMQMIQMMIGKLEYFSSAQRALTVLKMRFSQNPDVIRFYIQEVELLTCPNNIQTALATQLLDKMLAANGTAVGSLQNRTKPLQLRLCSLAQQCFEAKDWKSALTWYDYGIQLYNLSHVVDTTNRSKLHRGRAYCLFELDQHDLSVMASEMAIHDDPKSLDGYFIQYKILLAMKDEQKAITTLHQMCNNSHHSQLSQFIRIIASEAQKANSISVVIEALDILLHKEDSDMTQDVKLTTLRVIMKGRLSQSALADAISPDLAKQFIGYFRMAINIISHLKASPEKKMLDSNLNDELIWFLRLSWSIAVKLGAGDTDSDVYRETVQACYDLTILAPWSSTIRQLRKNCLLIMTYCHIKVARVLVAQCKLATMEIEYNRALHCIQEWRVVSKRKVDDVAGVETSGEDSAKKQKTDQLQHVNNSLPLSSLSQIDQNLEQQISAVANVPVYGSTNEKDDAITYLLLVLELEAKTRLGHTDVNLFVQNIINMHGFPLKILLNLAAVLSGPHCSKYGTECSMLLYALVKRDMLLGAEGDQSRLGVVMRELIHLKMDNGHFEDALKILNELLVYIQGLPVKNIYPETELLRAMITTWNHGVLCVQQGKRSEGEVWCALSMSFLEHLEDYKLVYQDRIAGYYGEIMGLPVC